MAERKDALVNAIHANPRRGVFAVTGGGSGLLSALLGVPGASATVLEARVPYADAALRDFLGAEPSQACSVETARALALRCLLRARQLGGDFGFAITASLATNRPKRGAHRVHWAFQDATTARSWTCSGEDAAGEHCRDSARLRPARALGTGRALRRRAVRGERGHRDAGVRAGRRRRTRRGRRDGRRLGATRRPFSARAPTLPNAPFRAILPGAFNPLHDGHRRMRADAERRLGMAVGFELCTANVDKPPLDFFEVQSRLRQFAAARRGGDQCAHFHRQGQGAWRRDVRGRRGHALPHCRTTLLRRHRCERRRVRGDAHSRLPISRLRARRRRRRIQDRRGPCAAADARRHVHGPCRGRVPQRPLIDGAARREPLRLNAGRADSAGELAQRQQHFLRQVHRQRFAVAGVDVEPRRPPSRRSTWIVTGVSLPDSPPGTMRRSQPRRPAVGKTAAVGGLVAVRIGVDFGALQGLADGRPGAVRRTHAGAATDSRGRPSPPPPCRLRRCLDPPSTPVPQRRRRKYSASLATTSSSTSVAASSYVRRRRPRRVRDAHAPRWNRAECRVPPGSAAGPGPAARRRRRRPAACGVRLESPCAPRRRSLRPRRRPRRSR